MTLTVLDTIVADGIAPRERVTNVGDAGIGEYFLYDVGNVLLLKDPTVCAERQEPQRGNHLGGVCDDAFGAPQLNDAANQSVENALTARGEIHRDGDRLSQQLRQI